MSASNVDSEFEAAVQQEMRRLEAELLAGKDIFANLREEARVRFHAFQHFFRLYGASRAKSRMPEFLTRLTIGQVDADEVYTPAPHAHGVDPFQHQSPPRQTPFANFDAARGESPRGPETNFDEDENFRTPLQGPPNADPRSNDTWRSNPSPNLARQKMLVDLYGML
eukprot:scaffold1642_cov252-Pinguiococcus_pyrenoidosus.AAC.3